MRRTLSRDTAIGPVTLTEDDGALIRLSFGAAEGADAQTPLLHEAFAQLADYLAGKRERFTVPIRPQGTPFQLACWKALCAIPYGQTRTYAQQAAQVGNAKACRAVGMANHRNPLPIFIPCHRVIGADGSLTGYAGGLSIKEQLLAIERKKG